MDALGQAASLLKKRFDAGVKKKGTDAQEAEIGLVCKVAAS